MFYTKGRIMYKWILRKSTLSIISIKGISSAGQTPAGQTGPWYSLNGDKVLCLNIHLYMIQPLRTYELYDVLRD